MSIEAKIAAIHDEDLLAELEAARGGFLYAVIVEHIAHRQALRDAERAEAGRQQDARAAMGRDQRRRDAVRLVIEAEPVTPDTIQHIHSVLALCGLPYRDPGDEREFFREYGRNTLSLLAGRLKNPATGQMELQGLPYGPKARLVLLHLCTEAVRQRSPTVEVADSLSGFMREMGFAVTGGERGTIRQFKEQLHRLAACTMQIGLWDGQSRSSTLTMPPFRQLDLWRADGQDGIAWSKTVQFHQDFYDNLVQHALPVDIRAARAFSGSARKLDLLFWVGYRLRSLQRPLRLTWDTVHKQFGADNASLRSFRQAFKADVAHVKEVFPKLPLSLDEAGLQLMPTDPGLLLVPPKAARRKAAAAGAGAA
ncbi:pirin [Methylobacterium indicum]|uniref:replication protein RepA n=1 Tax=Methylobacterium indicum TaxID=1775910 RepID=UPI0007342EC3|nr:replication protein RepA [Methylobacterium indicum]KTS25563.1 pirin [Methylobacterium indicum]KTS40310.1 pirin [Methylobacterium indicum]KTS43735.1 pirin [Methylobacterium indicum]